MDRKSDPRAEASKMASLAIVWSVLAAVAYLGPIRAVVNAFEQSVHASGANVQTAGLRTLLYNRVGLGSPELFHIALIAVPFAIGAALLLAILTRVRPELIPAPIVLVVAGLVGLVSTAVVFLDQVYTPANQVTFLIALVTIVGLWLLVRLERHVRRLYRRSPAVATLVLAVLIVAYLVAVNTTTLQSLLLGQIDVWLGLISFVFVLYAAIRATQESIRLQ